MVLKQCLQIKADIEEIVHRLDRENWQQSWSTNRDIEKDVVTVITGMSKSSENIFQDSVCEQISVSRY